MLNALITLIAFLFAIGVIALVHELGHYCMARFFKMGVSEFALGFGKKIWGFVRNGTEWNLRLIPVAGFVEIKGMSPEEENVDPEEAFYNRSPLQRTLVLVAGASMNLVLALLIWWGVFYSKGAPKPMPAVIGRVIEGSAAHKGGLRSGDRVLSIQGQTLESLYDLVKIVAISPEKELDFKVVLGISQGDDFKPQIRNLKIIPEKSDDPKMNGSGTIGVEHSVRPPVAGSVVEGFPAHQAGIKSGDRIIEINGISVNSWSEMSEIFGKNADKEIAVSVLRDNKRIDLKITPRGIDVASGEGIYDKLKGLFSKKEKNQPEKTAIPAQTSTKTSALADQASLNDTASLSGEAVTASKSIEQKSVKRGIIGIKSEVASADRVSVSFGQAFYQAAKKLKDTSWQVLDGIYLMFSGRVPGGITNASGPVGIARMTGEFANRSFYMFLEWIALLSTYIGIFNLIPFPALDGGRVFFIVMRSLLEKMVKYEEVIHTAGLLLLLGVLVIVTYFDISKWFSGF
jgi:regulator of sigma E protease